MEKYNFTISSWFIEPQIKFRVSYKVDLLIREKIINEILIPNNVYDEKGDYFIGVTVVSGSTVVDAKLEGPEYDKVNNFTNYGIWLPYYKIKESPNELKSYVEYFFDVLQELLKKLNLPTSNMGKICRDVLEEVLNDPNYKYEEIEELDMDDIINELGLDK